MNRSNITRTKVRLRRRCIIKKLTHCVFNSGFLSFIAYVCMIDSPIRLILLPYLFLMGTINDTLDFKVFVKSDHRNYKTHSFNSPVIIGIFVVPFLVVAPFNVLIGFYLGIFGVLSYYVHLILDMFNPSGVYITQKIMIRGTIRYDNFLINFLILCVGIFLLIISLFAK
jgi:membrane-bound metal-dependent hydrolase YbcI (DUF457 family)